MDGISVFLTPKQPGPFFVFLFLYRSTLNMIFFALQIITLLVRRNGWHSVGFFHSARDAMFIQLYLDYPAIVGLFKTWWWFQTFFILTPTWGNDSQFD